MLVLWAVGIIAFVAVGLSDPDEGRPFYYETGEDEWINAPEPSEAPMTAREKLIKEMDERGSRFMNGQTDTPIDCDDYIP